MEIIGEQISLGIRHMKRREVLGKSIEEEI